MWKLKGTEVAWVEEPRKKSADRPHWTTILIGILSPTIGIVALTISLQSLQTSQQSMRVGQRAYLTVSNGRMTAEDNPSAGKFSFPLDLSDATLGYSFIVRNLGNTPATINSLTSTFELPEGWSTTLFDKTRVEKVSEFGKWNTPNPLEIKGLGDIAPKSEIAYSHSVKLRDPGKGGLTQIKLMNLLVAPSGGAKHEPLNIRFRIRYTDVFGEPHEVAWCWSYKLGDYPDTCSSGK